MPDAISNATRAALLFLHAQTALHPGSGTALGTVDLPVQRERHTGWPVIPGSTLKGVLRDACRERTAAGLEAQENASKRQRANQDPILEGAFGPARVEGDSAFAGALSVTDARLLAFPVRSLKGVFAWVTCPSLLDRLHRDLALGGWKAPGKTPQLKESQAAGSIPSPLLVAGDKLVLEEFEFTVDRAESSKMADWTGWFAAHVSEDPATRARLKTHLVALHDDDFTHFAKHATEVTARVGLDYERKTVRSGALFYQEFLPAETLLYGVVLAGPSRRTEDARGPVDWLEYARSNVGPVLQVGGDASVGKGLCLVRWSMEG